MERQERHESEGGQVEGKEIEARGKKVRERKGEITG